MIYLFKDWPKEWVDKWEAAGVKFSPHEKLTHITYCPPRPFIDEYNQACGKEGFVYTINHRDVCYIWIANHPVVTYLIKSKFIDRPITAKFLLSQKNDLEKLGVRIVKPSNYDEECLLKNRIRSEF